MAQTGEIDARLPCSHADTASRLEEARRLVEKRGRKLTPIRRRVLELLLKSAKPAKAYDLLSKLDGEGAAKPPTIYRALDFLQDQGLAHKLESLNAYVACGHVNQTHSAVFLICNSCQQAVELPSVTTFTALKEETESAGFQLDRTVIEAKGLCRSCSGESNR